MAGSQTIGDFCNVIALLGHGAIEQVPLHGAHVKHGPGAYHSVTQRKDGVPPGAFAQVPVLCTAATSLQLMPACQVLGLLQGCVLAPVPA